MKTDFSNSSSASFLGIAMFGKSHGKWWHKIMIRPMWNVGHSLYNFKWKIYHRFVPRHQYHIINTGLRPGYHEIDVLMLHSCFTLLNRYVEKCHEGVDALEKFGKELSYASDGMSAHYSQIQGEIELEAVELYRWWNVTRPADKRKLVELADILYNDIDDDKILIRKEYDELEQKIDDDETAMLHRLINIRGSLWA